MGIQKQFEDKGFVLDNKSNTEFNGKLTSRFTFIKEPNKVYIWESANEITIQNNTETVYHGSKEKSITAFQEILNQ